MDRPVTAPAPVTLPWGDSSLMLDLPEAWDVRIDRPDLSRTVGDYPSALQAALDHPEGLAPIETLAASAKKVAIVVDDPSRWTPVKDILPFVIERLLRSGLRAPDVSISVAVGRHHAVDAEAMRRRVGAEIVDAFSCFSPPVDDLSRYVDLGMTPEGVPVRVFRPVAEADLRILIGAVLPHLQAGFGGGYKLIFPGTSHRSTLGALHRQGLGGDAGRLLGGNLDQNPMRQAIRSAASRLPGTCFSISHLMGEPGQIFRVVAGDVDRVQAVLSTEAATRFRVPDRAPADIVVAGNDPWPGDPLMSFKALINHRAAGKPGGVLVGMFRTDPSEIDRSFPMPALKVIAASGALGGWIARRGLTMADRITARLGTSSQFMIRWARELVVDRTVLVYSPPLRERLGPRLGPIRLFSDQNSLWDAASEAVRDRPTPTVRVFPQGGLTYCPIAGAI